MMSLCMRNGINVVESFYRILCCYVIFFFNDTATTEIYTLSLHDALPISIIKNGDLIRTNVSGKIILTLLGGDDVFIAPETEIGRAHV